MEVKYKWLLDFCSYYDGEEPNSAEEKKEIFWFYEQKWVERGLPIHRVEALCIKK